MDPLVIKRTTETKEWTKMLIRLSRAISQRIRALAEKMRDKRYRDSYVASHTRQVLAKQMREFRSEMSQIEFAALIGKRQTMISRLENPAYVGWSLSTMLEVARKLNVAVFVRFVDVPTFLKLSDDMSADALHPRSFDESQMDDLVKDEEEEFLARSKVSFEWTNDNRSRKTRFEE